MEKQSNNIDASSEEIKKIEQRIRKAVPFSTANKEKMSELLLLAKGPNRNISEFAKTLGVYPSSLSRICNCQVEKVRAPLLAGIAYYADPESGVIIEQLMEAQGLRDPDNRMNLSDYNRECRRIFMDELINRGYTVKGMDPELYRRLEKDKSHFDFEITTDALINGSGKWAVMSGYHSAYNVLMPTGIGKLRIALDHAMACFYLGNNDIQRISLVVDRRVQFDQICRSLEAIRIPNEISVILVNLSRGTIEAEYVAPLAEGANGDPSAVFE